jgi:hypothetical protein
MGPDTYPPRIPCVSVSNPHGIRDTLGTGRIRAAQVPAILHTVHNTGPVLISYLN